jgi:hypothetical protein
MTRNVTHFEITEGTDFTQSFLYVDLSTGLPIDLTDYTADMKLKENMNGTYDGYANGAFVLELSTTLGGIILGGDTGLVTVMFTAEQTTNVNWNRAVYNLVLTSPQSKRIPFMNGFVTILSDTVA